MIVNDQNADVGVIASHRLALGVRALSRSYYGDRLDRVLESDGDDGNGMTIRESSENPTGTAASLRAELAACQQQLEECQRHSAQLAEENDRLRHIGEEALRETKAALEFTLKSARIGDWDLDLDTDTSHRSLRHDQCFGYREPIPEADWGISVFIQHLHPDDRVRVEASL